MYYPLAILMHLKAPLAPAVPMFSSAPNSYVLHVSLVLFVLSCSLLLPIKVNVFFWFGLVPGKRLKSGSKVITHVHVFKKFSKFYVPSSPVSDKIV